MEILQNIIFKNDTISNDRLLGLTKLANRYSFRLESESVFASECLKVSCDFILKCRFNSLDNMILFNEELRSTLTVDEKLTGYSNGEFIYKKTATIK